MLKECVFILILLQGQPFMSENHGVISRLMFVLDDWLGVVLLIIMP